MKNIIAIVSLTVLLSGCVTDHADPRAQTDAKYAKAQNKCNFEMRKAEASSTGGGYSSYLQLNALYRSCMAAEGYRVKVD